MRTTIVTAFMLCGFLLTAQNIRVVGDIYPPFTYIEENTPSGFYIEVLQAVLKEAKLTAKIELMTVPRATAILEDGANTLYAGMGLNEEREPKYVWIGPIAEVRGVFVSNAERSPPIRVSSLDEARPYTIGVMNQGMTHSFLQAYQFEKIEPVSYAEQNINKLKYKRIDMVLAEEMSFFHTVLKMGFARRDFQIVYALDFSTSIYLAANPEMDPAMLKKLRQAMETIRSDGTYRRIHKKYFGSDG